MVTYTLIADSVNCPNNVSIKSNITYQIIWHGLLYNILCLCIQKIIKTLILFTCTFYTVKSMWTPEHRKDLPQIVAAKFEAHNCVELLCKV